MQSTLLRALRALPGRGLAAALAVATAVLLVACGGGSVTPSTGVERRPLPEEFSTRKAVAYSPYRTAVDVNGLAAEVIPKANIEQDLRLIVAAGFGLIRVFDSSDKVARQTLEVIRDEGIDLKMQLGAYVQHDDENFSQAELARTVTLANEFRDIVIGVSIGNETMVSWSFNPISPATMGRYIRQVREQIEQPITTNDNWAFWAGAPNAVTDVIDYAALHTYPELDTVFVPDLWDWQQRDVPEAQRAAAMMDAAIAEAKRQYQAARNHLDRKGLRRIPIVIGETGWNAVDLGRLAFRAHPVNQKMYVDRLNEWAAQGRAGNGPKAIFYFEAFDEPWKQGDDKWGLFNVQRQARYVIQDLGTCGVTWVCEPGSYTDADALFFIPPTVNDAVTAQRYTLYSDAAPGTSELRPTDLRWDAFDGTTAAFPEVDNAAAPGDGTRSLAISPAPRNYGWGLLNQSPTMRTENLSGFAGGTLRFSVRTTYPGKIEIGISSDTQDRLAAEAYLQIGNGEYGYCNTGAWCEVAIPLSAFAAANPDIDLSLVLSRFIIADRYAFTGNPAGTGAGARIDLDAVYWQK